MLNGKEMIEKGMITGVIPSENVQQHGVDLNLIKVEELINKGSIPKTGKTQLPTYKEVQLTNGFWELKSGIYNITFEQGCKIPNNQMLLIRQRSSLLRCGGSLHSSVFDSGFFTENIGTLMVIHHPLTVEYGARICQIYNHECTPVDELYNGQFQADKQRIV